MSRISDWKRAGIADGLAGTPGRSIAADDADERQEVADPAAHYAAGFRAGAFQRWAAEVLGKEVAESEQ